MSTGAFLVQAALSLGLVTSVPIPSTVPMANLAGGVVFGSAMAAAGFCSVTIFAATGSGRRGLLAGFGGLLAGAMVLDGPGAPIVARLRELGPRMDTTLGGLAGISDWLVVLALVGVAVFASDVVERR